MIPTRAESAEVLYAEGPLKLDHQDVEDLKQMALQNIRKRIRVCGHKHPSDLIHEMFIIHTWDCYIRPHKHLDRSESFVIFEGRVDVVFFNESGQVTQITEMGDIASGLPFYFRLSGSIYHTMIIRSEFLVFHETTAGPFRRDQSLFAPWSRQNFDIRPCLAYSTSAILNQMKET